MVALYVVAVAKASLTFAVMVLIAGGVACTPSSARTPTPEASMPTPAVASTPASVTARDLQSGHWSTLPPAPIQGRGGASAIWTGHLLLVWGGFSSLTKTTFADGAAYDPVTNRWKKIHASPLSPRRGQVAVWTGTEMVVWGGFSAADTSLGDGAAYTPTTDSWRALPTGPLSSRGGAFGVWTGTEIIVLGGRSGSGTSFADGAAFNPRFQKWRAVAPPSPVAGHLVKWMTVVYAKERLLAWSAWSTERQSGPGVNAAAAGEDLFSYSPAKTSWQIIPPSPAAPAIATEAVVANSVVIVRGLPFACGGSCPFMPEVMASLDPVAMVWSRLPPNPWQSANLTVSTGAAVFAFDDAFISRGASPGDAIAYDPTNHEWIPLAATPLLCIADATVWTGREVLLFCRGDGAQTGPPSFSGLAFKVS
jgi:hypothetical protein